MTGVVWFWPGVVVALIVATVLAAPVARLLGTRRGIAWLLVGSLGVIVAATLTPIHGPTGLDMSEVRVCDLERHVPASWADLTSVSDISLNVALFIPLGIALALLPWTLRTLAVVIAAAAIPVAIEAIQYLVPMLARGCQSGDVIDNLCGLAVGLVVGSVVHLLVRRHLVVARH